MTRFPDRSRSISEDTEWDFFPGGRVDDYLLRTLFAGSDGGLIRLRLVLLWQDGALLDTLVPKTSAELKVGDIVECRAEMCGAVAVHTMDAERRDRVVCTVVMEKDVEWRCGVVTKDFRDGTFGVAFATFDSDDPSKGKQPVRRVPQFYVRGGESITVVRKELGGASGGSRLVAHYRTMAAKAVKSNPRALE